MKRQQALGRDCIPISRDDLVAANVMNGAPLDDGAVVMGVFNGSAGFIIGVGTNDDSGMLELWRSVVDFK